MPCRFYAIGVSLNQAASQALQTLCSVPNGVYIPCEVGTIGTAFDTVVQSQYQLIIEFYRPLCTVAIGEAVTFFVRVTNKTRDHVPAGTRVMLQGNPYFQPCSVALSESLKPEQDVLLALNAQPRAGFTHEQLQPSVSIVILAPSRGRCDGPVLAEEAFGLMFCDFTGELLELFREDGNLNVYILGAMGAGKSSLINTLATILWHEDAVNGVAAVVSPSSPRTLQGWEPQTWPIRHLLC